MQQQRFTFQSGGLKLEGILCLPDGDGPFPCVVICHPHPLYGGSMDNNVVYAVCDALVQASIAAFKFNFRGVGYSQGNYDDGPGEGEDAANAVKYVSSLDQIDAERIGLCGYSAGAAFSLPACCNDGRVKAIAAISLPLDMFDPSCVADCDKPLLLICGGRDEFTPAGRFLEFCRDLNISDCELIEGADHFWRGREGPLSTRTAAFFAEKL